VLTPDERRARELRLIERRAAESYHNEVASNGLVVIEAYYGQKTHLKNFLSDNGTRAYLLLSNPDYKVHVIDVTLTLRFLTSHSKLKLMSKSKAHLAGFYIPDNAKPEDMLLYIRYYLI
jgi:hypothetical protein